MTASKAEPEGSTLVGAERPRRVQHWFYMNFLANILIGADSLLKLLTHRDRFL